MEIGQQIGLALLAMLMAFAFYNDINRLVAAFRSHRAGVGTDSTTGADSFVDERAQLIEPDSFVGIGTFVIAGATQGCAQPGKAPVAVNNGQSHPSCFLFDRLQAAGRADINAFHTQIAGNFFGFNQRSPGMNTGPQIEHDD